jgi:RHS repeat-associated protein
VKTQFILSSLAIAVSCICNVNAAQTTNYTYNSLGLIETVDGPRNDVSDITTYSYTAQGLRSSITNALGHITQITSFDNNKRLVQWVDVNGITTDVMYSNTGEISEYSVAGRTTSLSYDAVGNLTGITSPNGSHMTLVYDDARRLIQMQDTLGNGISYTRDAAGNITAQQTLDAQGQLVQSQQQVFDELSRLIQTIRASGGSESYQYDSNDNLTQVTDAKNQSQSLVYDALNRLVTQTNALADNTQYSYDSDDNLIQVVDPKGLITQYSYDAYGNQISQNSPDTGLTTYSYDEANNRISQTDARGIAATYSYDALNRLSSITYPNSSSSINYDVSYTYDIGVNSIGRLSSVTDSSGSTQYSYTGFGELITQTQTLGTQNYSTQYHYNSAGQLTGMTYPSGKVIHYSYNANAQITQITLDDNGQVTPLMSSAVYLPFGGMKQLTFGNGQLLNKTFDLDYQLSSQRLTKTDGQIIEALQDINYSFDPLGNIVTIQYDAESIYPAQDYSFDYDALSRLITANTTVNEFLYSYDKDGNRLQLNINGDILDYSYPLTSNHLSDVSGSMAQSFSYDSVGNLISTDTRDYTYGDNNRLVQVQEGSSLIADYSYNASGQRVVKRTDDATTHFLYDTTGHLIAEHSDSGESLAEYIYLNGKRLAMISREFIATENYYQLSGNEIELPEQQLDITADFISKTLKLTESTGRAFELSLSDEQWVSTDKKNKLKHQINYQGDEQSNPGVAITGNFIENKSDATVTASIKIKQAILSKVKQVFESDGVVNEFSVTDAETAETTQLSVDIESRTVTITEHNKPAQTYTIAEQDWLMTADNPEKKIRYDFILTQDENIGQGIPQITLSGYLLHKPKKDISKAKVNLKIGQKTKYSYQLTGTIKEQVGSSSNALYYIHTDHLDTPKLMTNTVGDVVWSSRQTPFGQMLVDEDSDGDGQSVSLNFRFPGQYFDKETGLYYNYFRYYDPELGRYITSDPIGLAGGLNTYAYVRGNPINLFDFLGLDVCLESTYNPSVPYGLHQRVAVYDENGNLVYGQSFGQYEEGLGAVYDNTSDKTRDKKSCSKSNNEKNEEVLKYLKKELGETGKYNLLGVIGKNCRVYSQDAYRRLWREFFSRQTKRGRRSK